ncbi:AAA family ATPase [Rhizobium rhizogenes]
MLTRIERLKGMGVFSDFKWNTSLPAFKRYNVVYGNNGSGKTTLSRLLGIISDGHHPDHPTLEYKVSSETEECLSGTSANKSIRVFNSDYINLNIGLLEGNLRPILVVGEENKALAAELALQIAEQRRRAEAITAAETAREREDSGKGKCFQAIAKTISESAVGSAIRTYRRNDAAAAFYKLPAGTVVEEDRLAELRATLRQEQMDEVADPFAALDTAKYSTELASLLSRTVVLAHRSAASAAITRLAEHSDISKWVEEGLRLHRDHDPSRCEFCGGALQPSRWEVLERHFNAADQELKRELEDLLGAVSSARSKLAELTPPVRAQIYSEMRGPYDDAEAEFSAARAEVLDCLDELAIVIDEKLKDRNTPINCVVTILPHAERFVISADSISAILKRHNEKTAGFDKAKSEAGREIERHYLRTIAADIQKYDDKIAELSSTIDKLRDGDPANGELSLKALGEQITTKRSAISNAHKAGERLTSHLQTFLGRNDLTFASGSEGYVVSRAGQPARRLSEGERTAIAFIYFVVQLEDQDFEKANGIIVIDDPVSSLDASSIYQAFSFLKLAIKDTKQVFLLTHNHGFLRLLLNWLEHPKLKRQSQYYMLVCRSEGASRISSLSEMDKLLVEHPTEYHFLFKTLADYETDGTIGGCYHIPNVVRKVLETFLDFHSPSKDNVFTKLETLPFDGVKKTAIYKLSNDLSHFTGQGFEPGLVQESQNAVTYLLEMIRETAPTHFEGMMRTIGRPATAATVQAVEPAA